MIKYSRCLLILLVVLFSITPTSGQYLPGRIPRVRIPIYVQEYHVWWSAPCGRGAKKGAPWLHWRCGPNRIEFPVGPGWRRGRGSPDYPMLGPYDSSDPGVIRWQLRCAKSAGIDGLFLHLWPDRATGCKLGPEHIAETVFTIADEVGISIGIHDEVQFRRSWSAQKPDIMAKRIATAIERYSHHKSYLRIDGRPVYMFQFWSRFLSYKDLSRVISNVESKVGKIYWLISGDPNPECQKIKRIDAFLAVANSNFVRRKVVGPWDYEKIDWKGWQQRLLHVRQLRQIDARPGRKYGIWLYHGFNSITYGPPGGFSNKKGKVFVRLIRETLQVAKPDFFVVTSWNDWAENTAIEPGLDYEDNAGDPYFWLRIFAKMKGKEFTPPPLPPKESVDPWMWWPLFGIDRTPPYIVRIQGWPLSRALIVSVVDEGSAVKYIRAIRKGQAFAFVDNEGKQEIKGFKGADPIVKIKNTQRKKSEKYLLPALKTKMKLVLSIYPRLTSGGGQLWLYLKYKDTAKGKIALTYPANPQRYYYEPDYLWINFGHKTFKCTGSGKWQGVQVLLKNFDFSAVNQQLTMEFIRDPKSKSNDNQISSWGIFLGQKVPIWKTSVEISRAKADSSAKTFRLNQLGPTNTTFDNIVWLQPEDSEGNLAVPMVIDLSTHSSVYPWSWTPPVR